MKTIILAAGRAPRLLPLTKESPQCLLEVKGKTILERQVETLKKAGVKDIVVVCGYLADKVEAACKKLGVKSVLNPFYDVSGMAMTLWVGKEELKEGFLLIYSDILFDSEIVSNLLQQKCEICLAVKKDSLREEAEKVVEKNGAVESVSKERLPRENAEFIGMAKFSAAGAEKIVRELEEMAKEGLGGTMIETIDRLIKKGASVTAFDIKQGKFVDIDFPEDLKRAEKFLE